MSQSPARSKLLDEMRSFFADLRTMTGYMVDVQVSFRCAGWLETIEQQRTGEKSEALRVMLELLRETCGDERATELLRKYIKPLVKHGSPLREDIAKFEEAILR